VEELLPFLMFGVFAALGPIGCLVVRGMGIPLYWLQRRSYRIWTARPLEQTREALRAAVREGRLDGDITDDCTLKVPIKHRNSWRPYFDVKLRRGGEGTLIEVDAHAHNLVRGFSAIHGLFLVGWAWFLGAGAFSWELKKHAKLLRELVGGTEFELDEHIPMQVDDPTSIGAEKGAPASLRARVFEAHATFQLEGSEPTAIRVDALAITVGERRITWDELTEVEVVEGEEPHLAFVGGTRFSVPVGGHPREDLDWFVTYLLAVDDRHGSPTEEVDAARIEARRLARLKRRL